MRRSAALDGSRVDHPLASPRDGRVCESVAAVAAVERRLVQKLIPVVISGGAGVRLWPLSTPEYPKQFHSLGSSATMIQDTIGRVRGAGDLEISRPILICNESHLDIVQAQVAELGVKPLAIVLEPFGRNTAAVGMTAALLAASHDPEALVLLMPSDHVIARPEAFSEAIAEAAPVARERIILFGVTPTAPETGYGYIEAGPPLDRAVRCVERFVEKPDLATAEQYLASGRYLWNAGLFLFSPQVLIEEEDRLAPDVARATREAVARATIGDGVVRLDAGAFRACPSISLDHAVMEHTDRAAVMPVDAGWTDIGSWSSLWSQGPRDSQGNLVRGDAVLLDVQDSLVWSSGKMVAAVGVRDLIVVQTDEAVLILPRSRAQDVRSIVEQLQSRASRSKR